MKYHLAVFHVKRAAASGGRRGNSGAHVAVVEVQIGGPAQVAGPPLQSTNIQGVGMGYVQGCARVLGSGLRWGYLAQPVKEDWVHEVWLQLGVVGHPIRRVADRVDLLRVAWVLPRRHVGVHVACAVCGCVIGTDLIRAESTRAGRVGAKEVTSRPLEARSQLTHRALEARTIGPHRATNQSPLTKSGYHTHVP